ncbi:RDD family protein [Arundinibacter roseus]|uniref:RDD family protein n=1 Tax=Arundinibacter roseus TaxID=2070510 RepID=A0A4R4KFH8_9BACT|nr:RDD family protein [Arundinibacter roseus]TDB65299.1 RDD family protein [Arundinibacter roseus]
MTEQTTELTFLKSSRKRRIAAFIIDHFVMTFLMVSILFIALGPNFMDENNPSKMMTTMLFVMIPGFILYFAKDSLKGISVGKWIMGIMVRDENNQNETPSFGRLFLRNLFIVIWPVEFIVLATNDQKKRLGDKVAKTVVVKNPNKPAKLPRILALIGVGVTFFVFVFLFAGSAMKNSEAYKVATKEIEQNKEIIKETGGIKGYGMMPTGNVSISNGQGQAQFEIKVLGNTNDLNVSVYLEKKPNGQWKLIEMQK